MVMEILWRNCSNIILLGDFNVNLSSSCDLSLKRKFTSLLCKFNLKNVIDVPTRLTGDTSSHLRVKWQECFSEEDARGKEVIISYKVTDAFEYKLVEEYSFIPGFNDIYSVIVFSTRWKESRLNGV